MKMSQKVDSENPRRRELRLDNFEVVLAEVDHLRDVGYHQVGRWSLGQMCEHLAEFMRQSREGFVDPAPAYMPVVGPMMRLMFLGKILKGEPIKMRTPTSKSLLPSEWIDDEKTIDKFHTEVDRINLPEATFVPSPVFGKLTPDQWRQVHLWHCQHHLSFLVPGANR